MFPKYLTKVFNSYVVINIQSAISFNFFFYVYNNNNTCTTKLTDLIFIPHIKLLI